MYVYVQLIQFVLHQLIRKVNAENLVHQDHSQLRHFVSYSKVGITTRKWNNDFSSKSLNSNTVIISLGSNDYKQINTKDELLKLRQKVNAQRIVWILPNKASIRSIVEEVAIQNNDSVLPILHLSKDEVHPSNRGYKDIADKVK